MTYRLTDEGREYLKGGLPDQQLCGLVAKGPVSLEEAKKRIRAFSVALSWAKQKKLISFESGKL